MLNVKRPFLFASVLLLVVSAHSDDRSLWQKFVDFFSPAPAVTCDGPDCDALRELDKKIGKVEGRYSRERRPVHKDRLKKELDSLQVVRDSLWAVVEAKPQADSVKAAAPAKIEEVVESKTVEVAAPETESVKKDVCAHDTVYVRDTIVVHDTLYVVVTNKPADVASEKPAE